MCLCIAAHTHTHTHAARVSVACRFPVGGGDINTCVRAGVDVTDLSRYLASGRGEKDSEGRTGTGVRVCVSQVCVCVSILNSGEARWQ